MQKKNNKKIFSEIKDSAWFWLPILTVIIIFTIFCYYKTHYCKQIKYNSVCKKCIRWEVEDNGLGGKFHRGSEYCTEYRYYNCVLTYDSCGCTKLTKE